MHQLFVARLASRGAAVKCLTVSVTLPSPITSSSSRLTDGEPSSEAGCCSGGKTGRLAGLLTFSHSSFVCVP